MRVTWVHPSWRDLVIDDLVRDAGRRVAFLRACALPGVQLALSVGGGAGGERWLPLLDCDEDFDALGDAVHELCLELAQPDLERLLASLDAALDATENTGAHAELLAIAQMALETIGRRLDREHAVVAPGLLEQWFAVTVHVHGTTLPPPTLAHTWAVMEVDEVDLDDRAALARLEAFLRFAALVARYAPDELERMRFGKRHGGLLKTVLAQAVTRDDISDEHAALVELVAALEPRHAPIARALLARAREEPPAFEEEVLVATAVAAGPSRRVERILRDL